MDLKLTNKLFVICGATSGFGKSIALQLIKEKANVILVARGNERLLVMKDLYRDQIEILQGDITTDATISKLIGIIGNRQLDGILVNAGGPPGMSFNPHYALEY